MIKDNFKKFYNEKDLSFNPNFFTKSKANVLALIYQNSPCFLEDEEFRKVRSFLGEYKFKDVSSAKEIETICHKIYHSEAKIKTSELKPIICPKCKKLKLYPTEIILSYKARLFKIEGVCLNCHEEYCFYDEKYYKDEINPVILKFNSLLLANLHI